MLLSSLVKNLASIHIKNLIYLNLNVEGVAIEYTGAIQLGRFNVDSSDPKNNSVFIHEIAHQWFHGIIGNNSETESFLDEGFADFSTYYYLDKTKGSEKAFDSMLLYESGPANKKNYIYK